MQNTKLEKGKIYDLPLKEIRTENRRSFYIVEAEGKEYAIGQFEFQKRDPRPEKISCLVKDIHEGVPDIVQNFGPLLQRFYQEGEIYSFWVKRDVTYIPNGYYEVADWNGFSFRLQLYGKSKLFQRQHIKCRVRSLRDYRLCLELVPDEKEDGRLPFWGLEEILEEKASPALIRWIRNWFLHFPLFAEAREAFLHDNGEWLLMAIGQVDKHLSDWIKARQKRNELLLNLFREVCLHLLEASDYLKNCVEQERIAHQQLLSQVVQHTEELLEAERLIASGEHTRYISTLLEKMKKSGYLYQPERKLRVLMCIFSLEQELMEENMQSIFDIILEGKHENWQTEPFRGAFLQMLELYIEERRNRFDRTGNIDNAEGRKSIEKIIVALAIQLLLATEQDCFDRQVSRSMLYRYLTYLKGSKPEILLEKAFNCLSAAGLQKLEFGWREVKELTLLTIRLSYPLTGEGSRQATVIQNYEGKQAQLRIVNGAIQVLPLYEVRHLYPCLPKWLIPWHQLQVLLTDSLSERVEPDTKDVLVYHKMWKEVERALFHRTDVPLSKRNGRKMRPNVGDKVIIRILRQNPLQPDHFFCRIEDETFQGEGCISLRNIVRYGHNSDINAFRSDTGKPLLLQAEIHSVSKEDTFHFSMLSQIGLFVHQAVSVGDTVQCLVLEVTNGICLCVSSFGYSVYVRCQEDMPELKAGDYIEVEVSSTRTTGAVEADYLRQVPGDFTVEDAFETLIYSYADENVYDEEPADEKEIQLAEVMMEESYICELMHIIDRLAVLDKDFVRTYNYLGMARVLALLVNKEDMADYYTERMRMLQLLQQFAFNGKVDMELMKERSRVNQDTLRNFPLLQARLLEVETVSCIDHAEQNPFLWQTLQQAESERVGNLARLVLAYNLLDGFSMYEEKDHIRQQLNALLNIEIKSHELQYFGREDQYTEFKSSIVYPANNGMRADLIRQTQEIMIVICGFLNAEGGTLYLGVNNEGVACGLDNDLEHFKGSLDKFDLHVRNSIRQYLGMEANSRVRIFYPSTDERLVYAIEVEPCPNPVKCNDIYYQRQGSSTWPLLNEDVDAFLKRRGHEYALLEQRLAKHQVAMEKESVPPPAPEPVIPVMEKPEAEPWTELPPLVCREEEGIPTGQLRRNVVHSWIEGFGEDTLCYLHILSNNSYIRTENECWRNDILLSLAIHEDEADGYLVTAFESGRVVRVPISELLDKTLEKEYKRYSQDKPSFVCPARKDDALLTIMRDSQGRPSYRMDDVKNIKEGNMLAKGETLSFVETTGVMRCEIIPAEKKKIFKRIHNLKSSNIGINLSVYYGGDELKELEKMNIVV